MYIFCILYFLGYFFTFNHYKSTTQPWHIDEMFSQTVYVIKKPHSIDINTLLNSILLKALLK